MSLALHFGVAHGVALKLLEEMPEESDLTHDTKV